MFKKKLSQKGRANARDNSTPTQNIIKMSHL